MGYGRPHHVRAVGLHLKQPRRVLLPLSAEDVACFWRSFRTFRDLALVGLMLLDGLRSCEVLSLQLDHLQLSDAQMRVRGKGNKERLLPLPAQICEVLRSYLRLERPLTNSPSLFVCLKGRHRGQPMTAAGLRSLFRHHRRSTQVAQANPHRFRHTFGADMVRAGISLPALMHLMGHAQIHTTMLYVTSRPRMSGGNMPAPSRTAPGMPAPGDFMTPSLSSHHNPSIEEIFQAQIQTLALTLRPGSVDHYRVAARRFLRYLRDAFPEVQELSQLRRDPHMLGWFRWLGQGRPLGKKARAEYFFALRRLLGDCQNHGHAMQPDLIRREDIPPVPAACPELSRWKTTTCWIRNCAAWTTCRPSRYA